MQTWVVPAVCVVSTVAIDAMEDAFAATVAYAAPYCMNSGAKLSRGTMAATSAAAVEFSDLGNRLLLNGAGKGITARIWGGWKRSTPSGSRGRTACCHKGTHTPGHRR